MYERQYVGGYGIPAIPTKLVGQSWQSGYGKDAIPSYRLPSRISGYGRDVKYNKKARCHIDSTPFYYILSY